jgi:hypothetical protein
MEKMDGAVEADVVRVLVEELLRASFSVADVLASLIDEVPEDAFPGEDSAEVLLEMVVNTCRPALEAAGEQECWVAAEMIGVVRDRVFEDLRKAIELSRRLEA